MCLRAAWKCSVGNELGDNTMSIKIQVTAVKRTVSSIQRTNRITWNETEKRYDTEYSIGAEGCNYREWSGGHDPRKCY